MKRAISFEVGPVRLQPPQRLLRRQPTSFINTRERASGAKSENS
jgi:hypothetical protein